MHSQHAPSTMLAQGARSGNRLAADLAHHLARMQRSPIRSLRVFTDFDVGCYYVLATFDRWAEHTAPGDGDVSEAFQLRTKI